MEQRSDTGYFDKLLKNSKTAKRQVAVYLDDTRLEHIDMVTKLFSSISDSKSFSRNTLIEEAIDKFLNESEKYLQEEHDINVSDLLKEKRAERFDTVIFSSKGNGFEQTFLGQEEPACWYPCKISPEREAHVSYIAIYRGQPISGITHYAKIKEFKYDPSLECKVCYFDGDPIPLPNKVVLGDKDSCFFVGSKYTTLESLLNATKTDEMIFG